MATDKKIVLLKEIKRLHEEEDLTYREISPHFGKKEAWAGVYWRRNEHLHHLLEEDPSPPDTPDTSDTDTSDTRIQVDTLEDTDPVISTPEHTVEGFQEASSIAAVPVVDDGPGFVAPPTPDIIEPLLLSPPKVVTVPTYIEFIHFCKEHSENEFAKYLWERCEGNPRRPIRTDTMKVLDVLRMMLA